METIEEFDRKNAAKRAKLERDLTNARLLPTFGKRISWIGENGWDEKGQPREPISKSVELVPWIMHDSTAYKAAEHVAFSFGDSEHVSSKYRGDYCRKYLAALLDASEESMLDTVAVKGHYAGYFPETFDYQANRNYSDAVEVSRGLYVVKVGSATGSHSYNSASLEWYISQPVPYKVSIDLGRDLFPYKLAPRPRFTTSRTQAFGRDIAPQSWGVPPEGGDAVHRFKRLGTDRLSCDVEYLFDCRETMESLILPASASD